LERSEVIEKLKKHIPNYSKSTDVFNDLLNKRSKAINTAEKLNEFHKKNNIKLISVESNPSTQVYRIVEEILKSTENKI
jgi:hypothetical protein